MKAITVAARIAIPMLVRSVSGLVPSPEANKSEEYTNIKRITNERIWIFLLRLINIYFRKVTLQKCKLILSASPIIYTSHKLRKSVNELNSNAKRNFLSLIVSKRPRGFYLQYSKTLRKAKSKGIKVC